MSCTWRPDDSELADVARLFCGSDDARPDPGSPQDEPDPPRGAQDRDRDGDGAAGAVRRPRDD